MTRNGAHCNAEDAVHTNPTQVRENIMNAVTSFVTIVSLLLALTAAGGAAKEPAGVSSPSAGLITPSKLATNHNETLVRDAARVR
jgi:hypothetical protein